MVSSIPFERSEEKGLAVDVQTSYPPFDEEYFEWIDVFEAVARAKNRFTMMELGAGYGRWLIRGAFVARSLSGVPFSLVGVEAEPQHYKWLLEHFSNNGVNPLEHSLINAAVSDSEEDVWFMVGDPASWYGQRIANHYEVWANRMGLLSKVKAFVAPSGRMRTVRGATGGSSYELARVKGITLIKLLEPFTIVDLIDLDIQGAELKVLSSAAAELALKVKRVHIGTHSAEIESGLRKLFNGLGMGEYLRLPLLRDARHCLWQHRVFGWSPKAG